MQILPQRSGRRAANRDALAFYSRFRARGRLAPAGLQYVSSVVSDDGRRCWQLMECDDRALLDEWMGNWSDLVAFEVVPVISSADAAARFGR